MMTKQIINLNPTKAETDQPEEGDLVKYVYPSGKSKTSEYHEPVTASPVPVVFDGADWREYAYRELGKIAVPAGTEAEQELAGLARYGAILKDGRASTEPTVIAAFDQYDRATAFRKDKVTLFLGVLNSGTPKIVEDNELAAIIGNWPEV
jgi:hypothetical protein